MPLDFLDGARRMHLPSSMMLVFDEIRIVPLLGQMKRVETFFSRLTSVKEVVLKLDSTPNGRCLARGSDETLRRWATHLQHLLNCILERGCSSLTVMNGTHFIEAYQVDPPGFPLKYLPERIRKVSQAACPVAYEIISHSGLLAAYTRLTGGC
ncbi:hypothetical protein B0H14DRAFT_1339034 [Mycena olivaceomarginata]|nr:hypothetical protein B0H14DRAFT_1339034 [Mycena olivaceomarginata]